MRGNLTITSKQWQVAENFKKKKKKKKLVKKLNFLNKKKKKIKKKKFFVKLFPIIRLNKQNTANYFC